MGLFSKLFGGNEETKASFGEAAKNVFGEAGKQLGNFVDATEKAAAAFQDGYRESRAGAANAERSEAAAAPAGDNAAEWQAGTGSGSSGLSWGEEMPAEENQFNYPGTYKEYFDHVFRTEFPEYQISSEEARYYSGVIYTFRNAAGTALIVELLPQSSAAVKLRNDCKASGIPYLRYYYDHEGWWNTYSYVRDRTRAALGG